jgi:hypothetical protein
MAGTSSNCLAIVLKELGWSYTRLIAELRGHSSIALPKTESMVTLISRWVNNHQQPDDFCQELTPGDGPLKGSRPRGSSQWENGVRATAPLVVPTVARWTGFLRSR